MEAEAVYIKVCSHILWLCESLIQLGSCCSIFGSAHKQHLGQLCTQLIFVVLELLNKSLVLFVQERFHRQLFVQRLAAERIQFCIIHHILVKLPLPTTMQLSILDNTFLNMSLRKRLNTFKSPRSKSDTNIFLLRGTILSTQTNRSLP